MHAACYRFPISGYRLPVTQKKGGPFGPPPFFPKVLLVVARRYHDLVTADRDDHEIIAAVTLPAILVVVGADRPLFTVANKVEPAGVDAVLDEVLLRRGSTTLTECEVVLIRAALVGVAFDADSHSRIGR